MARSTLQGHFVALSACAACLAGCAAAGVTSGETDPDNEPVATVALEQVEAVPRDQEAKLEALLAELRPTLDVEQRAVLDSIQAEWQALREADCRWERTFFGGGSVGPEIFRGCMARFSAERIERLKLFLCEGWGMTGPCPASEKYDDLE